MRCLLLVFVLTGALTLHAQTRADWYVLEDLNHDPDYPFTPEKPIRSNCLLELADSMAHYKGPIQVFSFEGNEILRIGFSTESGLVTTFKSRVVSPDDSATSFRPWYYNANEQLLRFVCECDSSNGGSYRVRLGDSEFGYIGKNDPRFRMVSVDRFVLANTRHGFDFDREKNSLKDRPEPTASTIVHIDQKKFPIWSAEAITVSGDWLEAVTIKGERGWVRWRDGENVLIRMYLENR